MTAKPELTYFDIRGRAEPIRLLLEEVGVEYDDVQVGQGEWADLKPRTPFGQVPLFREGDVVIPQSRAICRHLVRVHQLEGEDETARTRCDVAIEALADGGQHLGSTIWHPDFHAQRKVFLDEELPPRLQALTRFFEANPAGTAFWAGASLTLADISAFTYLENLEGLFPGALSDSEALTDFRGRFAARPRIAAYLASPSRPAAIMYGPARGRPDHHGAPGPMDDSVEKIYPAGR